MRVFQLLGESLTRKSRQILMLLGLMRYPCMMLTWLAMNSVDDVGVMRMRFIMPFSRSCAKDCPTIMIRNIDANVNMPGAIKSSAETVFTSTRAGGGHAD